MTVLPSRLLSSQECDIWRVFCPIYPSNGSGLEYEPLELNDDDVLDDFDPQVIRKK